jgi:hypothetical protein
MRSYIVTLKEAKISDSIVHHPIAYPHMGIQVDAFKRDEAGNFWTGTNLDSRLFVAGYVTNLLGDLVLNESEDPSTYFDRVRIVRDHKLPFLMYIMYRFYCEDDWDLVLSYVNNRLASLETSKHQTWNNLVEEPEKLINPKSKSSKKGKKQAPGKGPERICILWNKNTCSFKSDHHDSKSNTHWIHACETCDSNGKGKRVRHPKSDSSCPSAS